MSGNMKWALVAIIGVLGVGTLALITAALAAPYFQYSRNGGSASLSKSPGEVLILNPTQGTIVQTEDHLLVQVYARGLEPWVSTELWINGELSGEDVAPGNGLNAWNSILNWSPNEPGKYSLVARAFDSMGRQSTSSAVVVLVTETETLSDEELALSVPKSTDSQTVFPAANPINPAGPEPDDSIVDGTPWTGSPIRWMGSLFPTEIPQAPYLGLRKEDCEANLLIQDRSDNEDGFILYRQTLNGPVWHEITRLNSGNLGWVTYVDDTPVGDVTYYAAAFNQEGEAASNLMSESFSIDDCSPNVESPRAITVRLTRLQFEREADQAYCYRSIDGVHWSRWPEIGFFEHGAEVFDTSDQSLVVLLDDPGGGPPVETLNLELECWGWTAGQLQFLGVVALGGLNLEEGVRYEYLKPEVTVEVFMTVAKNLGVPFQLQTGFADLRDATFALTHNTYDPTLLEGGLKLIGTGALPHPARMPYIDAWLSYSKDDCFNHLDPESQVAFGTLFLCSPHPEYNEGPGGANPQPYIVWNVRNDCGNGSGDACLPHSWWMDWAEESGRNAYAELEGRFSNHLDGFHNNYTVTPLNRTMLNPYYNDCEEAMLYRVRYVFDRGQDLDSPTAAFETIVGPWSNWVSVGCGRPLTDTVFLEVTFDRIIWSHVDDDDVPPQDIETHGDLSVARSLSPNSFFISAVDHGSRRTDPGSGSDLLRFQDGVFNLADVYLCKQFGGTEELECVPNQDPETDWNFGNNKVIIPVGNAEALRLGAFIYDYDEHSKDDPVCVAAAWTDDRTLQDWAGTHNELHILHQGDNDHAECTVEIILNAVSP